MEEEEGNGEGTKTSDLLSVIGKTSESLTE
jgi:hypothetical protein